MSNIELWAKNCHEDKDERRQMKDHFITEQYYSNCLVEALRAKRNNPDVTIYFCIPRITENGHFQMAHFMWSDGKADYDFSDDEADGLPWYRCFWFKGAVRQFDLGFAKKYSEYRNRWLAKLKNRLS